MNNLIPAIVAAACWLQRHLVWPLLQLPPGYTPPLAGRQGRDPIREAAR